MNGGVGVGVGVGGSDANTASLPYYLSMPPNNGMPQMLMGDPMMFGLQNMPFLYPGLGHP